MTDIADLAREILTTHQDWLDGGFIKESDFLCAMRLAQMVLDNNQLPKRGEQMPQTPEQFAGGADLYEKALLKADEENSLLRSKYNEIEQKQAKLIEQARQEQEQKEKVAQWIMSKGYATGHGDSIEGMLQELIEHAYSQGHADGWKESEIIKGVRD